MRISRWLRCAALVISFWSSLADGQDKHVFAVGGGISGSLTNSLTVSHGHAYFVAGEPGFLFGGVQDDAGKWKLNYLVLLKHGATKTSSFEHGNPEPTVSSDFSDGMERRLNFKERLRIDGATLDFSYRARIDLETKVLNNEQFTVQGKPMQVKSGRVIVVDMTVDPIRCRQVNVNLPANDEFDFLNSRQKQYEEITKRWMTELMDKSEIVAKTFKR